MPGKKTWMNTSLLAVAAVERLAAWQASWFVVAAMLDVAAALVRRCARRVRLQRRAMSQPRPTRVWNPTRTSPWCRMSSQGRQNQDQSRRRSYHQKTTSTSGSGRSAVQIKQIATLISYFMAAGAGDYKADLLPIVCVILCTSMRMRRGYMPQYSMAARS